MEDLATDRIYRLMIAQRMRHRDVAHIVDDNGNLVAHTPELITRLFDEELARVMRELPPGTPAETAERFTQARVLSERMITTSQFNPS
jgi:malate synthase